MIFVCIYTFKVPFLGEMIQVSSVNMSIVPGKQSLTYRASSNLANQRSVGVIYKKETSLLAHSTTNLIELFRFFELCREREKKYILIKYLIHY